MGGGGAAIGVIGGEATAMEGAGLALLPFWQPSRPVHLHRHVHCTPDLRRSHLREVQPDEHLQENDIATAVRRCGVSSRAADGAPLRASAPRV